MTSSRAHNLYARTASFCASVLRWWWDEMREIWHAALVQLAPRFADQVRIELTRDGGAVEWTRAGKAHEAIRFTSDESGLVPRDLLGLMPGVRNGTRARVHLREEDLLTRELILPQAAERELQSIVGLQLERVLPLPRDLMYVDWYIRERRAEERRIVVALGAVRRSHVDSVRECLLRAGLRPHGIGVWQADTPAGFDFNRTSRSAIRSSWGRMERALSVSLGMMVLALAILWPAQAVYESVQLGKLSDAEHARAAHARQFAKELRTESKPLDQLQKLLQAPRVSDALAVATDALPEDSWVYELEISNAEDRPAPSIRIKGFSPIATSLARVLAKSSRLQSVALIKSSTATGLFAKDRFEVAAQLAPAATAVAAAHTQAAVSRDADHVGPAARDLRREARHVD